MTSDNIPLNVAAALELCLHNEQPDLWCQYKNVRGHLYSCLKNQALTSFPKEKRKVDVKKLPNIFIQN